MTLISVHNSEGLVGRCDAKCVNATGPDCDCICGGRNHGVGLQQPRFMVVWITVRSLTARRMLIRYPFAFSRS